MQALGRVFVWEQQQRSGSPGWASPAAHEAEHLLCGAGLWQDPSAQPGLPLHSCFSGLIPDIPRDCYKCVRSFSKSQLHHINHSHSALVLVGWGSIFCQFRKINAINLQMNCSFLEFMSCDHQRKEMKHNGDERGWACAVLWCSNLVVPQLIQRFIK